MHGDFMKYDTLLQEAYENDIKVKEIELRSKDGLCRTNRIAINKNLKTDKEKCCILAEELGHYYLTVGDITDQTKIKNRKQELTARNWGYEKLVGIIDIINAFNLGIRTKHEMAEHLNITEEFLEKAIQHYKQKYGIYMEIDEYLVYFEPSLIVVKKF